MYLSLPLLALSLLDLASAVNLFPNGAKGRLLGSTFGVPGANATFDYVVVGGGTAGITIATRLSATGARVALVEAGGFYEIDNGNYSTVPGYATFFTGSDPTNFQPGIDWGISTVPQPGASGRNVHYARGKTLGGSSARNYMLYQRGTIDSYQKWANDVGDQSYTFDNILPYFKKSVHYTPPNQTLYTNSSNRQTPTAFSTHGGPLEVSFSNAVDPFGTWAQRTFEHIGLGEIDGFDSGHLLGSAYATLTINPENAHRSSSETSFLQTSIQNGTSPTIYQDSLGSQILFDSNKTAIGVRITTAGTYGTPSVHYTLNATKEVIISAGAFQSPQLLMVSGIGPRSELAKFNIPCISDLQGVGENMWDHPIFGVSHRVNVNTASAGQNNATLTQLAIKQYLASASGSLSIFGAGIYGWEKLPEPYRSQLSAASRQNLTQFPADWPELEWLPQSSFGGTNENKQTADPRDGYNYATLAIALVAPVSRGTVKLQCPDMTCLPVIDPKWLEAEADKEIAVQAVRRQREAWQYLVKVGIAHPEEYYPGANVSTNAEILAWIGDSMTTVYHASATCKMGVKSDSMAVLDNKARVYGVQNLRVVDASSFPFLPPGHPQSTIYMLAEKIADDILRS